MSEEARFLVTSFTSLFFIVDPFASIPLFLSLSARGTAPARAALARRTAAWCGFILVVFASGGNLILGVYGISIAALRAGGGIILLLVALDMLRARRTTQETPEEVSAAAAREDISLTPLATPMLAGPGAISTVMVLSGQARGIIEVSGVFVSVVVVALLTWGVLRAAEPVNRFLGESGRRSLTRLMGLLLAALAVQFMLDGLKSWFFPPAA